MKKCETFVDYQHEQTESIYFALGKTALNTKFLLWRTSPQEMISLKGGVKSFTN